MFPLYAKPCTVPQEHKGEQGRHRRCQDGLLLAAFLPFIHASDLLRNYYVPCSGLGCGECKKKINVSLLKEKQVGYNTLTFTL